MTRFIRSQLLRWIVLGGILTTSPLCGTGEAPLRAFTYRQVHMGMPVRLTVYASDEETARQACRQAFERIAQLDGILSDYRRDSEVSRLCRRAGRAPMTVSDDLFQMLELGVRWGRITSGAVDVTVGPLVDLWRQARRTGRLPSAEAIRAARSLVGWRKIRLDPEQGTAWLPRPGMRLDFGAIAKGYIGDAALHVLATLGLHRALYEAGGDIVVGAPPPGAKGWTIRLFDLPQDRPSSVVHLSHAAISTSGDTEQFVEIEGRHYSHVVDPRTGMALTQRRLATVIAPTGITADALSTAITVLGEEKARSLIRSIPGAWMYLRKSPTGSAPPTRPKPYGHPGTPSSR